ncbi:hypothetical protein SUGI_0373500 [Cryptomeria japonica]|nr:hypothetical protein SUGI_0373500 [Cryptomeria japonica]
MAAHAVLVPFPSRGHVNPMMHLALKLASQGISVTFVLTELWRKIISQNDENPFSQAPNLQAALIPDCVVDESQRWADMVAFIRSLSDIEVHVAQLLTNLKHSGTPATCIVADVFLRWAVPFAKHTLSTLFRCVQCLSQTFPSFII